jgi:hypothetical protein
MASNNSMEFPIPEGFTPPEHLDSDNQFQAMATFELIGDSSLKLIDVEGYQVGTEDTEKDTGQAKDVESQNAASALQAAMAGGGPSAGGQSGAQPGPGLAPGAGGGPGAATGPGGAAGGPVPAQPLPLAQDLGRRFRQMTGRR